MSQNQVRPDTSRAGHFHANNSKSNAHTGTRFAHFTYTIQKSNAHTTARFANFNRKLQKSNAHTTARSGLFGSRKMTPKSNLPEGRVKINVFQPAAIAQICIALAIATSKSTKSQRALRTADAHTTARSRARAPFQNVPRTQA